MEPEEAAMSRTDGLAVPGQAATLLWTPMWVNWLAPGLALIVVAVSTLTQPYGPARNLVDMIIALVVAVLALALRLVAGRPSRAQPRLVAALPFALAAMAITSGSASLTNSGGPFSLLSSLATTIAGSVFSMGVGIAITSAGAATVLSAGLVYQVGTWGTFGYPTVMFFSLILGRILRGYRVHAEQSAALMANLEQLQGEQRRAAALDERNRIAREIHDLLAHSLGSLGLQIQVAQALLTDQGDIDRAVAILGQARRSASDGLSETRRALQALRADTPPLPDALANLGASHQRHYAAQVDFDVTGQPRALSADASLALTRTAQEALVNTAKHAPNQPVRIRLDYQPGYTTLSVANPVTAAAPCPALETVNGGYGLAGLRERLLLIDGALSAGPDHGDWVVTAQVPQ
jgi:signal transduction histidine kinase